MKMTFKLAALFLLLAVCPTAMVAYLSYRNGRTTIEHCTIDHLIAINGHKKAELGRWIDNNVRLLEIISQFLASREDETATEHLFIHRKIIERHLQLFIQHSDFFELFILGIDDGNVLISTNPVNQEKHFKKRPYFIKGRKGTYAQNIYYSMVLQQPAMTLSTPLKNREGHVLAVLAGRVDLTTLSKIFEIRSTHHGGEDSYLVNNLNFFVTEPRFGRDYALKKAVFTKGVTAALAKQRGTAYYDNYQGKRVIGAYQWLDEWKLGLITEIGQAEAFAPIYLLEKTIVQVGLVISFLAILTGWAMAQTIIRPVQRLLAGTEKIGTGDLTHSVATSSRDEIGDLSRAFDRMKNRLKETLVSRNELSREVAARKKTEARLWESRKRLSRAEAIGHLGNWRLDSERKNFSWSDEIYRICGVTPATFTPTFAAFMQMVHPDDRTGVDRLMDRILAEDKGEMTCRLPSPEGELRHMKIYGEVEKNDSGKAVSIFGTILDITEAKRRERELEEKNWELERFTYTISHDLKSPVVTVRTFAGYLEEDLNNADAQRIEKDIFYIRNAAEKMDRLLDELLKMSRIGWMVNTPIRISWRELVQEAADAVAGGITAMDACLEVQENDLVLFGDRPRLAEIWQNLLENAVKYMGDQPQPRIEIGFLSKNDETLFFVRDNGMGIDPRYRHKVFGWFEKIDPASTGTGLGLALVKRIVEFYSGTIWLESEGNGQGTCFYFTLPAAIRRPFKGDCL